MENKFKTPKTSSLIANDIKLKIIRGELKPGDFLPPETQLMVELGFCAQLCARHFVFLRNKDWLKLRAVQGLAHEY